MNARSWTLLAALPCILAAQAPQPSARIQRMAEAGRLWVRLRWVHPALAEQPIDWDRQLVEVLPAIAAAETPQAQKEVLERWLGSLQDPALRVGPHLEPRYVVPGPDTPLTARLPGNGLLVGLHDPVDAFYPAFGVQIAALKTALAGATRVVFDLRPSVNSVNATDSTDYLKALLPGLIARPLDLPATRYLYDRGWPAQTYSSSGGYYTAWLTHQVDPCRPDPDARPVAMAFIVDEQMSIPSQVLALQKAGLAHIVSAGPSPNPWMPVETRAFGTSWEVTYRLGEWLFPDGSTGWGADQVVPSDTTLGPDSPAVRAALTLLDSKATPGARTRWHSLPNLPFREPDKAYREMSFPSLPWRQFAVIRFWSVIDAFFPYKDLMDRPWADALPEFLADMERVQDAEGYSRTLARMAARLQDNHVAIEGTPFLDGLRGQAGPPVLFRMVEKAVLVDRILDAEKAQGLHRWDEVLEVDGEPVAAWMARVEPFVPFANAWTRDRNLVRLLGRGADGTTVRVKVKAPEGSIREVLLSRSERFQRTFPQTLHPGDTVQILPGGVGYADLGRLLPSEVDAFFTKIMGTEALILDMRGYPHGTAWSIAPRLNVRKASVGATFFPTTISAADPESDSSTLYSEAKFPDPDGKPLYKGKVVMLIDATTQSQAEYTGQLIEAACGVTFIGSPSAGSNGDVTNLRLPGGITVSFTGQGVRNADGRQLQRVGLQPRILVRPTIQGLREGRDEVMDRALRFLKEGH